MYEPEPLPLRSKHAIRTEIADLAIKISRRKRFKPSISLQEMDQELQELADMTKLVDELTTLEAIDNCPNQCHRSGYAIQPVGPGRGVQCLCPAGKMRYDRGEHA